MRVEGQFSPSQARSCVTYPLEVPEGTRSLTLTLRYRPAQLARIRNLVTITLFDPAGFRGAGHRHAPEQTVQIGERAATPGFIAGPLTTGRWTIELDLHAVLPTLRGGIDFSLEAMTSNAPTDAETADDVPMEEPIERRAPDEPDPAPIAGAHVGAPPSGWLKGDLHLHSNHSDGRWSVADVVEHARRHRLDFLALTDHNTISARDELKHALRAARLSPVVIDGMELTTFWGHANALGVSEWIDWRTRGPAGQGGEQMRTMRSAAADVHGLGGLFVVNHPRSAGYPWCTGCRWEYGAETLEYADALEVLNGPWPRKQNRDAIALWDQWLNAGHRIPATAGTDSHGFAKQPEQLGFTYVRADRSVASILGAVRAGESYLSRGPSVEWLDADGSAVRLGGVETQVEVALVVDGKVVSRQRSTSNGDIRLAETRTARWRRVEVYARGEKGPLAVTNPVFTAPR